MKGAPSGLRKEVPSSPSCWGLFSNEVFPPERQQTQSQQLQHQQDRRLQLSLRWWLLWLLLCLCFLLCFWCNQERRAAD